MILSSTFSFILLLFFLLAPRLNLFNLTIHTGIISVAILVLYYSLNIRPKAIPSILAITITGILAIGSIHSIRALAYGASSLPFLNLTLNVIVSLVFSYLYFEVFLRYKPNKSDYAIGKLFDYLLIIIIINSVIVLVQATNPAFRDVVESFLFQDPSQNIMYSEHSFKFRGFASSGGASLSLLHFMGVLILIHRHFQRKISHFFFVPAILVVFASNIFIGRTGLAFSLIAIAVYIIFVLKRFRTSGIMFAILLTFIIFEYEHLLKLLGVDDYVQNYVFGWLIGLIQSGELTDNSIDTFSTMYSTPETMIGWLIGEGYFSGDHPMIKATDSGYLKSILSMGFPISILIYFAIGYSFLRLKLFFPSYSWLILLIALSLFVAEIKEPFLYQNFTGRIVFLFIGILLTHAKIINISKRYMSIRSDATRHRL